MRIAALALVSACALAACNPSAPSGQSADNAAANNGGGSAPAFGQASYRADMMMTAGGQSMPTVMYRSGSKTRTETTTPMGSQIMIMDTSTHEGFVILDIAGTTVARHIDAGATTQVDPGQWRPEDLTATQQTGTCNVAGESGAEYTRTMDSGSVVGCVTSDGIMLRTSMNGSTVMEATRIQRGPQEASLFTVPPGVQVVEGNDMSAIAAAVARAKGGH